MDVDGMVDGFDIEMIEVVRVVVDVFFIVLGGVGKVVDFVEVVCVGVDVVFVVLVFYYYILMIVQIKDGLCYVGFEVC